MPAGVGDGGGAAGGVVVVAPLLPPPQPRLVIVKAQNTKTRTQRDRLRFAGLSIQIKPARPRPANVAHKAGRGVAPGSCNALLAAVVVIVSVVWPPPTTELGLNLQA